MDIHVALSHSVALGVDWYNTLQFNSEARKYKKRTL